MPRSRIFALGRLARKLVNERRMVQASGKMLIASSSRMVGVMNSQAMARSDRPRTRRATASGVARTACSTMVNGTVFSLMGGSPGGLDLPVLFEDLLPVDHQ